KRARFRGNGKKGEKKRICMNVRRTAASTSLDQADRLWDAKRQGKQIAADNATTGRVSRDHRAGKTWLDLGDLPITQIPDEIAAIKGHLRILALGKVLLILRGGHLEWARDY